MAGRANVGSKCMPVDWSEKDVLGQRGTTARDKPSDSHGQNYTFKLRYYENGRVTRGKDIRGERTSKQIVDKSGFGIKMSVELHMSEIILSHAWSGERGP